MSSILCKIGGMKQSVDQLIAAYEAEKRARRNRALRLELTRFRSAEEELSALRGLNPAAREKSAILLPNV